MLIRPRNHIATLILNELPATLYKAGDYNQRPCETQLLPNIAQYMYRFRIGVSG